MTYNTKYTGNEKWLNKISLALGTCMCDMYKFIKNAINKRLCKQHYRAHTQCKTGKEKYIL